MDESSMICPTEEELAEVKDVYKCTEENCRSIFKNISNLRMHLNKHHKKGLLSNGIFSKNAKYVCPVDKCIYNVNSAKNKWFTQRRLLKQHYMKVHAEKRHICSKCNGKFSILSSFQRHIKICGAKFLCGVCHWEYNSNESLMVHLLRKHPNEHKKYIKNKKSDKIEEYITNPININIYNTNNLNATGQVIFDLSTNEIQNVDDPEEMYEPEMVVIDNSKMSCETSNVVINSNEHDSSIISKRNQSKLFNENKDCFTQTSVKTVKKSSHSKIKKLNAETQTSIFKDKQILLKQVKRIDKATNISRYLKKSYRTFGTQTIKENSEKNLEERCTKNVKDAVLNVSVNCDVKNNKTKKTSSVKIGTKEFGTECLKFSNSSTMYDDNSLLISAPSTSKGSGDNVEIFTKKSFHSANSMSTDTSISTESQVHIETQTALDELLYSNLTKDNVLTEDDSSLFSELISISDIQTQTAWPNNSGESIDQKCSLNTNSYNVFDNSLYSFNDTKNDFISTETQTCHFPDFTDNASTFNLSSSYFSNNDCEYFSGENIDHDFLDRNKVLRSDIFFSCETQTCFQDLLGENSNENKETNKQL